MFQRWEVTQQRYIRFLFGNTEKGLSQVSVSILLPTIVSHQAVSFETSCYCLDQTNLTIQYLKTVFYNQ